MTRGPDERLERLENNYVTFDLCRVRQGSGRQAHPECGLANLQAEVVSIRHCRICFGSIAIYQHKVDMCTVHAVQELS